MPKAALVDTGCNCGWVSLKDIMVPIDPPKWDCPDNPVTCQRATCDECVVLLKALEETRK